MRTRILAAFCTTLSLAPLAASRAQEADGAGDQEAPVETDAAEVVDAPAAGTVPARGRMSAPGTQHTIESGDTLWDLTQRYLGSPWYWPKVWSYNPEIANPHYIYPGNRVRFFNAGEDAPARVDVQPASGVMPTTLSQGTGEDDALLEAPAGLVSASGPLVYDGPGTIPVAAEGFITDGEVQVAGRIEAAETFGEYLMPGDVAYLRFQDRGRARVGDRHTIFRPGQAINHPVTGRRLGYLTTVAGTLVVTQVSGDGLVTGQVVSARDSIVRGDRLGPAGESTFATVQRRPNAVSVDGVLVAGLVPELTMFGEAQRVLVDRGSADGVQVGNTFKIVRQQDQLREFLAPQRNQDARLPAQNIGSCLVVDVREHVSSCLLTRSVVEVHPGDRVAMRPEGQSTAQR